MNATQAQAALKRLFGKAAAWRYDDKAAKAHERERLELLLPPIVAAAEVVKAQRDARRIELLADPEYVRLCAEARDAAKACDGMRSRIRCRRVTVGHTNEIFFHVVAEGDNWQDAIDNARAAVKAKP